MDKISHLSFDVDEVVMDVVAVHHLLDTICEHGVTADPDTNELIGGLQRAAWYTLKEIRTQLERISKTLFEATSAEEESKEGRQNGKEYP